jgi:hypothetical protein
MLIQPVIQSVNDLTAAIESPDWFTTVQAMDSWLPGLVARVPWRTAMSQRFLLHYHIDVSDEYDSLFEHLLPTSEQLGDELESFFDIVPLTKLETLAIRARFNYFIIKTRTKRTFGSLTDPYLLFYFLDPKQDPKYLNRFRHELAHWGWSRLYGEAPPLFQEGVAVYAELRSASDIAHRRHELIVPPSQPPIPPLSEIVVTENFWKYQGLYDVAGSFVQFLVTRWGWKPLKKLFLRTHYEDQAILQHFQSIYGQSLDEADRDWRGALLIN